MMAIRSRYRSQFRRTEGGTKLLVLVHGWRLTPSYLAPLVDLLATEEELAGYDFLLFGYDASLHSNRRLSSIAETLSTEIAAYHEEHGYESISLLGHSIGGLIARQAYLLAMGLSSVHSKAFVHSWGRQLGKGGIVLLASPNRGSSLVDRSWLERQRANVATLLGVAKLVRDSFRGSEFVTNLRLDWMRAMARLGEDAPNVALILGELDREVVVDDSLDMTQFPNASHYIVGNEDHDGIGRIEDKNELKYGLIYRSLVRPRVSRQETRVMASEKVDTVVFLVHGIRDYGGWLERMKEKLQAEIPNCKVILAKYKYFTISRFLWKPARLHRVMEFRDQYTQALAKYPGAVMHFVGHSFGTYILANSLKIFRSIRFSRVYFAGSVVPRAFDWQSCFEAGQISVLRNDCAASDYPVGFLCRALQALWSRDLGVGGFRGFLPGLFTDRIDENKYLSGGHAAAVDNEENLSSIADFLTSDSCKAVYPEPGGKVVSAVDPLLDFMSSAAPILMPAAAVAVVLLLALLSHYFFPYGTVLAACVVIYFLYFY